MATQDLESIASAAVQGLINQMQLTGVGLIPSELGNDNLKTIITGFCVHGTEWRNLVSPLIRPLSTFQYGWQEHAP